MGTSRATGAALALCGAGARGNCPLPVPHAELWTSGIQGNAGGCTPAGVPWESLRVLELRERGQRDSLLELSRPDADVHHRFQVNFLARFRRYHLVATPRRDTLGFS